MRSNSLWLLPSIGSVQLSYFTETCLAHLLQRKWNQGHIECLYGPQVTKLFILCSQASKGGRGDSGLLAHIWTQFLSREWGEALFWVLERVQKAGFLPKF